MHYLFLKKRVFFLMSTSLILQKSSPTPLTHKIPQHSIVYKSLSNSSPICRLSIDHLLLLHLPIPISNFRVQFFPLLFFSLSEVTWDYWHESLFVCILYWSDVTESYFELVILFYYGDAPTILASKKKKRKKICTSHSMQDIDRWTNSPSTRP